MKNIKTFIHPLLTNLEGNIFSRKAARAIIVRGDQILLLYTERYNDYTFPGGGMDNEENIKNCLIRELREEVGANTVRILREYGHIEEYRPFNKDGYQIMHMTSYFFVCDIEEDLVALELEDYEIKNGMKPIWINIRDAIYHNQLVMKQKPTNMGLSIQRETYMLEKVAQEFLLLLLF